METSPPTLDDLYALKTVEGIAFWCSNHACQHHDSAPVGVLAGEHGPGHVAKPLLSPGCRKKWHTGEAWDNE